jgi:hypothetical protein
MNWKQDYLFPSFKMITMYCQLKCFIGEFVFVSLLSLIVKLIFQDTESISYKGTPFVNITHNLFVSADCMV